MPISRNEAIWASQGPAALANNVVVAVDGSAHRHRVCVARLWAALEYLLEHNTIYREQGCPAAVSDAFAHASNSAAQAFF